MEIILIDIIRYLINGFLAFSIFSNFKKSGFRKAILPSLIYTFSLTAFKVFIIDNPIVTVISVIMIFLCLLLENKFKDWNFLLTYSLFVSCVLEYSHFLIFKTVSIVRNALQLPEVTYTIDLKLIIFRATVALLYALALFLIYKFSLTDLEVVSKLSNYKVVPIFLSVALSIIIYLKHYIKYTLSNEFHDILSILFVFFAVIFFIFIASSKRFIKMIDKFNEKKINPAIEEAKLQKGKRYAGMNFISEKLKSEMECFKDELEKIGMDKQDHGSLQIAFAAVLLKHEEDPENVALRSKIYFYISEILEIQPTTVESNISNSLKRHWNLSDKKIISKIEENYEGTISEKNGAPTPKEFLTYIVKKVITRN